VNRQGILLHNSDGKEKSRLFRRFLLHLVDCLAMQHYMLEALLGAGQRDEAARLRQSNWRGNIKKGADTFREVYLPDDDFAIR
jgi:hypothetical protein